MSCPCQKKPKKTVRQWIYAMLLGIGILGAAWLSSAYADERLFTYSYEATSILPKGKWEFEQWVTGRFGKEKGDFARWDFREEMEYGVTDRFTTAVYLNFKSEYEAVGDEKEKEFEFEGVSSENKYQILNPYKHPIGLLAYFEPTYSGDELEFEEKIILQKNIGENIVLVANAIAEEEWEFEGDETEKEFVLSFTAGASYRLSPHWAVGLELRNHREFPDYKEEEHSAWFLGPNIHYATEKWWATLTVLPQISGRPDDEDGLQLDEHERIEVRCIAGIFF